MKRRLLLNIVVGECAAILELLPCKDQALLVGRDALLILDLRLNSLNGVRGLHVEGDRLSSKCLYEDLHSIYERRNIFRPLKLKSIFIG